MNTVIVCLCGMEVGFLPIFHFKKIYFMTKPHKSIKYQAVLADVL